MRKAESNTEVERSERGRRGGVASTYERSELVTRDRVLRFRDHTVHLEETVESVPRAKLVTDKF